MLCNDRASNRYATESNASVRTAQLLALQPPTAASDMQGWIYWLRTSIDSFTDLAERA